MRKSLSDIWRRLHLPPALLADWCGRWGVAKFSVYGSVLYRVYPDQSDVNLLVTFRPGRQPDIVARAAMTAEATALLGRRATLAVENEVEADPATFRRISILSTAQTLYQQDAGDGSDTEELDILPGEDID